MISHVSIYTGLLFFGQRPLLVAALMTTIVIAAKELTGLCSDITIPEERSCTYNNKPSGSAKPFSFIM